MLTGLVDMNEALYDVTILSTKYAACKTKISVEPSVPQPATIGLDPDLYETIALLFAHRLDAETGRVGVSTDHRDGIARLPFLANRKGNHCRAIPRQVVLAAWDTGG